MSGHVGLREDAQAGHKLALLIAALFLRGTAPQQPAAGCRGAAWTVRTAGKRGLFPVHGAADGRSPG